MICTKCGRPLPENARFCGVCGTPVMEVPPAPQPVAEQPAEAAPVYREPAAPPPETPPAGYNYAPLPPPQWQAGEKEEKAKPLSVEQFMLQDLLMMVPVLNLILLLVWAFSDSVNPNRRNWARAGLIWYGIGLGFVILTLLLALAV